MEKIVVMNSGGFDSVVMLHEVVNNLEKGNEIYTLHFTYGERNRNQQYLRAFKSAQKLKCKFKEIKLPEFEWTKSNFYGEGYDCKTQYLEWRNLVFLSYALSYAEAIGATKIYMAVFGGGDYNDTSSTFFHHMRRVSKKSGITIVTPFLGLEYKEDIVNLVFEYGINKNEYFSCDVPDEDGNPCGECPDCKALKTIEEWTKVDHPFKRFLNTKGDLKDPWFKELLVKQKVQELRMLINNECQLKCSHCFYGFSEMKGEKLPKETMYGAIKQASELGIKNIHFSGKEPLVNDDILYYAHRIKEDDLPLTFDLVTNGINIPKYIGELAECGLNRVYLSVDGIVKDADGVRSVGDIYDRAMCYIIDNNVPLEIFIDLHGNNYNKVYSIISHLIEKHPSIDQFFIRTIRSLGNAEGMELLTPEQLDIAYNQLKMAAERWKGTNFVFSISMEYEKIVFNTDTLNNDIGFLDSFRCSKLTDNLEVYLESYCNRYGDNVTLTPDGYLLGCASEVSCQDYDKISVGNISKHTLNELIERGKKVLFNCNDVYGTCDKKCSFLCKPLE